MQRKRTFIIVVALLMATFTVLSSCNIQDVEYLGQMLEESQSNTGTTKLPVGCTIVTTKLPQTTPHVQVTTTCAPGCRCHRSRQ